MWTKLDYDFDDKGNIVLPPGPPFDGKPVLVRIAEGIVEAWWVQEEKSETFSGVEHDGFYWVCLDDTLRAELDDVKEWMPIPAANIDDNIVALGDLLQRYLNLKPPAS